MEKNTAPRYDPEGDHEYSRIDIGMNQAPLEGQDDEEEQEKLKANVHAYDVLCGRGKVSFNHIGNKRFRQLVNNSLDDFVEAGSNRKARSTVCRVIQSAVETVGGRFLKKDNTGNWVPLTKQQVKDKIGHAIRDAMQTYDSKKRRGSIRSGTSDTDILMNYRPEDRLGASLRDESKEFHPHEQHGVSLQQAYNNLSAASMPHLPQQHQHQLQQRHHLSHYNLRIQDGSHPSIQPQYHYEEDADESESHADFEAHIDNVLGPLPPDAEDPMKPLLEQYRGHKDRGHDRPT